MPDMHVEPTLPCLELGLMTARRPWMPKKKMMTDRPPSPEPFPNRRMAYLDEVPGGPDDEDRYTSSDSDSYSDSGSDPVPDPIPDPVSGSDPDPDPVPVPDPAPAPVPVPEEEQQQHRRGRPRLPRPRHAKPGRVLPCGTVMPDMRVKHVMRCLQLPEARPYVEPWWEGPHHPNRPPSPPPPWWGRMRYMEAPLEAPPPDTLVIPRPREGPTDEPVRGFLIYFF